MQGGNLQSLRRHNRSTVLASLQRAGHALPLTAIKMQTGLSRPTIESMLRILTDEGLVTEAGTREVPNRTQGGRPARSFAFNPSAGTLAAIVIGLDDVQVAVSDLSGTLLGWRTIAVSEGESRQEIALTRLRALMRALDLEWESIRSVTIGIMGVHTTTGTFLRNVSLPEVSEKNYFDEYKKAFYAPIHFVNDGYLAALAQFDELCDPQATHSMIGLHATTAIGCGILINGQLFQGFSGAAAEMGFDESLGWTTADRMIRQMVAKHQVQPATLFKRAGEGDPEYQQFARDFITTAMPGIRALNLALDPQVFTIGGAITQAASVISPILTESLAVMPSGGPEIRFSSLGEEAIVTGALRHGVRDIEGALEAR